MRRSNFKFSWGSILPLYSLSVTLFLQLDPIRRAFSWTIANKYEIVFAKIMFDTAIGLFAGKFLELRLDPVKTVVLKLPSALWEYFFYNFQFMITAGFFIMDAS